MASSSATRPTVKLSTKDDQLFEVDRERMMSESEMVRELLNDIADDTATIPLMNVDGPTFAKVVEYLVLLTAKETEKWDEGTFKSREDEFVKVDQKVLFEMILAANYLNIKKLLDLCCLTVANMIKGKTPDEISKTFNIKNDFTEEEEAEVRRENQWAFE